MPYSRENYKKVHDLYQKKRADAESDSASRRRRVYDAVPSVRQIDDELSHTGLKIIAAANAGPAGLDERMAKIKADTEKLRAMRNELLTSAGFASDYDDVRYECPICSDTGYNSEGYMCKCFRRALTIAGLESSGMGNLITTQTFETFSLGYYDGRDLSLMRGALDCSHRFVDDVTNGIPSYMLFFGKTGLGKTHLSSAIAKEAVEGGCDVVYVSAQNLFSDFEFERFNRSRSDDSPCRTDRYFDCDLLIMDDLGTEVGNQFTVSCLYNLINSRITNGKSMLISTNENKDRIFERYDERITSRLFGEFRVCIFAGKDVRSQKLSE